MRVNSRQDKVQLFGDFYQTTAGQTDGSKAIFSEAGDNKCFNYFGNCIITDEAPISRFGN